MRSYKHRNSKRGIMRTIYTQWVLQRSLLYVSYIYTVSILPFDQWLYILQNIIHRNSFFSQNFNLFGLPWFDCPQIRILFQHFCWVLLLFLLPLPIKKSHSSARNALKLKKLNLRAAETEQGTNREGETFQFNLISNFGLIFSCHCLNCWPTTTTTNNTNSNDNKVNSSNSNNNNKQQQFAVKFYACSLLLLLLRPEHNLVDGFTPLLASSSHAP